MLEEILNGINITGTAQRIYIELISNGSASARTLAENLSLPKSTVYDGADILLKKGLVAENINDNKKVFSIVDPQAIGQVIEDRKNAFIKLGEEFSGIVDDLKSQTKTIEPKIRFFSGKDGVKTVLNDLVWYKDITTYTMWPMKDMLDVLDRDYYEWINDKRRKQNIRLKSIRKQGDQDINFTVYPGLDSKPSDLRELRFAPDWMDWTMSYWIYADKVAFISAGKEHYGFIIHSADFVSVMKMQFEAVWELSSEV